VVSSFVLYKLILRIGKSLCQSVCHGRFYCLMRFAAFYAKIAEARSLVSFLCVAEIHTKICKGESKKMSFTQRNVNRGGILRSCIRVQIVNP